MIKWRRVGCAGCIEHKGDKMTACMVLVWKPEGNRPLGRRRRRWEDNIKMDGRAIGWVGMDSTHLAQDRNQLRALVNTVMNLRVPWKAGKFLSNWVTNGFSRRAQWLSIIIMLISFVCDWLTLGTKPIIRSKCSIRYSRNFQHETWRPAAVFTRALHGLHLEPVNSVCVLL
jgi:hypothetical protein